MDNRQLALMEQFIVRAKRATYAGGGKKLLPYRLGSYDLQFKDGDWAYHDSYFGGSDFLGQEVVYFEMKPVWGMNYYGRLLRPELITVDQIGQMLMKSLTKLYEENRFLGGFEYSEGSLLYIDSNTDDVRAFQGIEQIYLNSSLVYELTYHGGLIHD
jgi:hypothetical protein